MPKPIRRQTRMDVFLDKSPKKSKETNKSQALSSNGLRQATIQSLSRVVNVDHIRRCKRMLKDPSSSKEIIMDTLIDLMEKIPSKEVMLTTRIGQTIRKLTKHQDEDISKQALVIYKKWRKFFVDQSTRTQIDVQCCNRTERRRVSARDNLAKTLGVNISDERVIQFEREVFHSCKAMPLHQYQRIVRGIVLEGKCNESLRLEILKQSKKTTDIVNRFK